MTVGDVTEHEHEFDGPPTLRHLACCVDRNCTEWRVGTGTRWRELTSAERVALTCRQFDDLIVYHTMVLLHGRERGAVEARYRLGYGPSPYQRDEPT